MALLIGALMRRIEIQRRNVERRAEEAEALRDELGRRADLLDAANRCARALSSSLDLDEAFGEFIRELRGLVPFERMAIVLAEEGVARVIATAGAQADEVMPPGTVLDARPQPARRCPRRRADDRAAAISTNAEYAEEPLLRSLGIRSRVAAPLAIGARDDRAHLDRTCRAGRVQRARGRARQPARAARRLGRPEHPRVRQRAPHRRRATAPVGAARRLRLAGLARAAQPDGGGDRRLADPAGALARAAAGPASGVPGVDRRRDFSPRRADRRRARHLSDRGRHLQLPFRRRRPRDDRPRHGRVGVDRPGRGADRGGRRQRRRRPRRRRASPAGRRATSSRTPSNTRLSALP